ncbi:MAG: MOSC N-terminal beta barrel domain-containing protein [Pirellulales bacterium]|nr:MOSC N-terminal beta barrel domain-containing protein [Pirellulales bacterium]
MPRLTRITIYPIKSLDGCDVREAVVLPTGSLAGDRRYELVDSGGNVVNGKKCAAIHNIRAAFGPHMKDVTLGVGQNYKTFSLAEASSDIAQWCSEVVGKKCHLVENAEGGFSDDSESPGPTLISTASLTEVSQWFSEMDLAEVRRRFRMNLEIDGPTPFWEDRLVAKHQTVISRFQIGDVIWQGRGICQRCVVPTRDARLGTPTPDFPRVFSQRRQASLPVWSPVERFDHFYRLGVNTALDMVALGEGPDRGKVIRVGDSVTHLG